MAFYVALGKSLTINRHEFKSGEHVLSSNIELLQQLENAGVVVEEKAVIRDRKGNDK